MWFLFGVITLISVCCYQAYKRLNAAWTGDEVTLGTIKYQYKFETEKGKVKGLLIGISGPDDLDFTLKREKTLDRFFKRVGIAREHQTGNQTFDDLVYVVSDHQALQEHISNDDKILKNAVKIFSYSWNFGSKVDEICCNSGRLWLHLKMKDDFEKQQPDIIAKKLVPWLKSISDSLRAARIKQCSTFGDSFVVKAAIILAISSALLINGLIQSFRILWQEVPFVVDISEYRSDVIWISIATVFLLVVGTFYVLSRSARTHLVLLEVLITGSLGTVLTVGSQLRDFNMDLDTATAQRYSVLLHDKRVSKGRRSNSYYLYVDDWLDDSGTKRVSVSSDFYSTVATGDNLLIMQKPGYLDYRWVERVIKL